MKVILLICMALFLGCQTSAPKIVRKEESQITQKERQLDEKIAKIDKAIGAYISWVIAMGEKLEVPKTDWMNNRACFVWELGPHGQACLDRHSRAIMVGYRPKGGKITDCCDQLPLDNNQAQRVRALYERWEHEEELLRKQNDYNDKNAMKNRLQRLVPKEAE
jgi:hypothetical protein